MTTPSQTIEMYDKFPFPNTPWLLVYDAETSGTKYLDKLGVLDKINNQENANILVVGCGTGERAIAIYCATRRKTIATDISKESIELAKQNAEKLGINQISFLEDDLFDSKLPDNHFDLIVCDGVLHHTTNPKQGIFLLSKKLRENGVIVIGVYYARGRKKIAEQRKKVLGLCHNEKEIVRSAKHLYPDWSETKIYDTFVNPIVSHHSIQEVFSWLNSSGLLYFSSNPPIEFSNQTRFLFAKLKSGYFRCNSTPRLPLKNLDIFLGEIGLLASKVFLLRIVGIKTKGRNKMIKFYIKLEQGGKK